MLELNTGLPRDQGRIFYSRSEYDIGSFGVLAEIVLCLEGYVALAFVGATQNCKRTDKVGKLGFESQSHAKVG